MHVHFCPAQAELRVGTLSQHGALYSGGCAWMDAWPRQLLRSHRMLPDALFLGRCSHGTEHHCGQAAWGRGAPAAESKRAGVSLPAMPPKAN